MPAELDLVSAVGACSPDESQQILKDAISRGVDPLALVCARRRIDDALAYARAAHWAGLAFMPTLPDIRRFPSAEIDRDRLAGTWALKMRLIDRDVTFMAPDFAHFLSLRAQVQADADTRRHNCIVPPRKLREALVIRHRDGLIGFSRNNLMAAWPRATARLGPGLRIGFVALLMVLLIAAIVAPFAARPVLVPVMFVLLVLPSWFRIAALIDRKDPPAEPRNALAGDAELPVYSLLIPLRDEAQMVPQLLAAIGGLDYPAEKLDVKFIVEEDSPETLAAVEAGIAGTGFERVTVPSATPHTKPKALNFALPMVRGELVVVYDAEDLPEPDQLRRTATRFLAEPDLGCIQAELVPDNANENVVTALFASEYGGQFGLLLPALARWGFPMPLGGTSNHFRTAILRKVGGWDAFNVTEDADLGLRLARLRIPTSTITARTYEEAPVSASAWFRQRTRWMKGWMQTFMVHNRRPLRLLRDLGFTNFLAFEIYVSGMIFTPPLHTLYMLAVLVNLVLGRPAASEPDIWSFLELFTLGAGYLSAVGVSIVGLTRLGRARLLVYQPLLPVYWGVMGLASFRAAFELVARPYYWSKTSHGISLMSHPPGGLVSARNRK